MKKSLGFLYFIQQIVLPSTSYQFSTSEGRESDRPEGLVEKMTGMN